MRSRDARKRLAAANPCDRERAADLPLSSAEDELRDAILAEPPLPPPPATHVRLAARRGPRLAVGGVVALAVASTLIVSAGGDNPPAAFAVEPQKGGGVTIKIYSLDDASGLEQALAQAGIRSQVTWLPAGKVCREPHYKPSTVRLPGGGTFGGMTMGGPGGPMTIGVNSAQGWRESFRKFRRGEISAEELANVNLDPKAFRPDQSVVLSGSPAPYGGDPEGGSVAQLGFAEGPVEPCEPVSAPSNGSARSGFPRLPGEGPATNRGATEP